MASDTAQGAPIAGAPDPGPPLDPALLQVIRSSAGRLTPLQDAFIRQLRANIVTMIPDLAEDGWALSDRVVRAVLWAATTDQPPQLITDGLRWLGAANWQEGFPETQYVSVAHALVRAVHVLSESNWSTSLGSAWISYFLWMKPYLMLGAQQAAQAGGPGRRPRRRHSRRLRTRPAWFKVRPAGTRRCRTATSIWSRWEACSTTRTRTTSAPARSWSR